MPSSGLLKSTCTERKFANFCVCVCVCQGPEKGFAPTVEKPTIPCEGKLCKAGKTGLAKSSSSFQVSYSLKPTTAVAEVKKSRLTIKGLDCGDTLGGGEKNPAPLSFIRISETTIISDFV